MKPKEEQLELRPKTPRIIDQTKMNINDFKSKPNTQKNAKQYNVQLIILEDIKKLKVNLEITDKNKYKVIYNTTLTLEELISLNPFFKNFEDYSEAFDYLLKNFTKIDRTKIAYLNNNKEIKIVLLFSIKDISEANGNDAMEEGIEIILHCHSSVNPNKSISNLTSVINNLKISLEKFNLSIKEIKSNVNNDKIEKDKKIKELENSFNKKIDEIMKIKLLKNSNNYGGGADKNIGQNYFDEKFIEIYSKMEEYENDVITIKQNVEDEYLKQRNEINKNNKIFLEKENELSQLITEKFKDFINKINNLDERDAEIENELNSKLTELDNKTNICFNELIKKINKKNNNVSFSENDLKIKLNEIIGKIMEENENLEKKLENKMNQKIEELTKSFDTQITNKIAIFEEKIKKLEKNNENKLNKSAYNNIDINKVNDRIKELEQKLKKLEKTNINQTQNKYGNNNDEKLKEFNTLITKKLDDLEKYKKNLFDTFEKTESKVNKNKLKIDDLDTQMAGLYEELYKNKTEEKKDITPPNDNQTEIKNIKNDINNINTEIKNNINQRIKELTEIISKKDIENLNIMETVNTLKKKVEDNSKLNTKEKQVQDNTENNDKILLKRSYRNKNSNEVDINSFENKTNEIFNKIDDVKEELYTVINKINDDKIEDSREINTKILNIRSDFLKLFDSRINSFENKIKSIDEKFLGVDDKINKITKDNQAYIEKINSLDHTKENDDTNNLSKFNEFDLNLKSFDSRIKSLENKIKQMDKRIDSKRMKDSYSTKTLTNSNSNRDLEKKDRVLYKSTMTKTLNLNIKESEESNLKNKRYSFYNLLNRSNTSVNKDKSNIFDLNIDTNILKKEDISENFFLFSKLKEIYPYNRYIKLILIYRATRDGDSSKDFHAQCDFIGPNLTLVKTKKGYIFGGFTVKNWKHLYKDIKKDDPENGTEYKDDKAFGFSVNKKKIYENGLVNEAIIYCNNNYGVCFKNYFFKILDKCFKNGGICGKIDDINFDGIDKEYEFNGGEEKFGVEEIEVFQIGFR